MEYRNSGHTVPSTLRIVGLIDSLAPGGAQRQFVELMTGLAARGHDVSIIIYHRLLFFKPQVLSAGIPIIVVESSTKIGRIVKVNDAIKSYRPDAVVSFLDAPNAIAEICNLLSFTRLRVIASERIFNPDETWVRVALRMLLHRFASHIVSNSYAQSDHLIRRFPRFTSKISSIHNCVDLENFAPVYGELVPSKQVPIRFVVVASYIDRKNPLRFAEAFACLVAGNPNVDIQCDWYGDQMTKGGMPYPSYSKLVERVAELGVSDRFRLHGATNNIVLAYQSATALCLPSLAEGCANVICEAMACGLPILASNLGDNSLLVRSGISGFLFDPESVVSICTALQRFCDLSPEVRKDFRANSRMAAEALFGREEFLNKWESVIRVPSVRPNRPEVWN